MKLILALAFLAAGLATGYSAAGVVPEKMRACPPWVVTVVDADGHPVAGANILQEWGCDFNGTIVMATTNAVADGAGKAKLESRYLDVPTTMGPVKEFIVRLNSPGGMTPWNNLTVAKSGFQTTRLSVLRNPDVTWTHDGLRATVVLPRWKPGS
jgi:hypothetical protein